MTLSETAKTVTLGIDDSHIMLSATVTPTIKEKYLTWSSSDPTIASVDSMGQVAIHKTGSVTITASVEDATASCTFTINPLVIRTTEDSTIDANITTNDFDTAKALKEYAIRIQPSQYKGLAQYEARLLSGIPHDKDQQIKIVELLDITLVEKTSGTEVDYDIVKHLFPLDINLAFDQSQQAKVTKNFSLWRADEEGNATIASNTPDNGYFRVTSNLPSTYAVIKTSTEGASGDNDPSAKPDDPQDPSKPTDPSNPSDGDNNQDNGSDNSKPQTPGSSDGSHNPTVPPADGDNQGIGNGAGADGSQSAETPGSDNSQSQENKSANNANESKSPEDNSISSDNQSDSKQLTLLAKTSDPINLHVVLAIVSGVLIVLLMSLNARRQHD